MTWPAYFDACSRNDFWAAFEALASTGALPVVIGEDKKGKIKRPMAASGEAWQRVATDDWANRLGGFLKAGVPVGIGCKPVGFLVLDVDPKGKDTANLSTAWREMSQLLFGEDDPPRTLTVRTEAGCHVWFRAPDGLAEHWSRSGKRTIKLPSGGMVELYLGIDDGGYQVACAPSEGKTISIAEEPIDLPADTLQVILDKTTYKEPTPDLKASIDAAKHRDDMAWARMVLLGGYADSEVEDYDSWLRVGMALSHRFGEAGSALWEEWSTRHNKHVDQECYRKVESFKRSDGNVARFGSLVAIVSRNGGPPPPRADIADDPPVDDIVIDEDAANVADIRALMKERSWLWGDTEKNVGWFIERGLHLVEGKEGTGKTRWLMDLCRRWSMDLAWPDGTKTAIDPKAKILFVAADSHWDQIADTAEAYGIPDDRVIFAGPQSDPYANTSIDDPATIAHVRHFCDKYHVAMVVVDTLMAASTRPLVDPQEVAKIAGPLRQLARDKGIPVVLVGHLNANGETWGRSMGRTCDHVIRMEADEHDEQLITIRSVKARWNRFALPTITARQTESGWECESHGSDTNDTKQLTAKQRAMADIADYVAREGRKSWSEIVDEMTLERSHTKPTIDRALKSLTCEGGRLESWKESFPSGKSCTFYDLRPQ